MSLEAGPSRLCKKDNTEQLSIELAKEVVIYQSTKIEKLLDNSVLVSNEVSMARDQLANERNWLTWFRISCTLIILGFSILIKFRLPEGSKKDTIVDNSNEPIGYVFIGLGFLCFFLGLGKYFKNQSLLIKQATYIQAGWGSLTVIALLFCFVCTVLVLASINRFQ